MVPSPHVLPLHHLSFHFQGLYALRLVLTIVWGKNTRNTCLLNVIDQQISIVLKDIEKDHLESMI